MIKYKTILFWAATWIVLFVYLQVFYKYHFFYIEQNDLFLFDADYLCTNLMPVGGFSHVVAAFLNQFFIYPFAGAAITTTLLIAVGVLTGRILRRIAPKQSLPLLCLLPVVTLMFIHFDFNYFLQGTVSFMLCLLALWLYVQFGSLRSRLICVLVSVPLLFWLAGPVSILLVVCVFVRELITDTRRCYWFLIPVAEAILLSIYAVRVGWLGEYRFAMLPDLYYHWHINLKEITLYLSWITLVLAIAATALLRNRKPLTGKKLLVSIVLQLVLIVAIVGYRHHKYIAGDTLKFKEMEYYNRTQQWDKVIEMNSGAVNNYLYACYLNMALAQKGELGERMFEFNQPGLDGLISRWIKTQHISKLVSDIYFTYGSIAAAQEKGFEVNIGSPTGTCAYALQRLVQTNIIMGEYAVAEKYIDLLSKTLYYKDWAESHRKFLYNDEAVNADKLLGNKRKCIAAENDLYQSGGILGMLTNSAESNPGDKTAIEYMGGVYMLSKSLQPFGEMLDKYYGTAVLPALPKHFQEAAIILYDRERETWPERGITPETIERFNKFEQFIRSNQNRPQLAEAAKRYYGNTYWYYFMFK